MFDGRLQRVVGFDVQRVTDRLQRMRLFAGFSDADLITLIGVGGPRSGETLDVVPARPGDVVIMLDGGLHMLARDGSSDHLAILSVDGPQAEPGILYTIPTGAMVRLTRPSQFIVIDGELLDQIVSGAQEQRSLASLDDVVRERSAALMRSPTFKRLTFDQVVRCAEVMDAVDVAAGDVIIFEGETGDSFFVIESGHADVLRAGNGEPRGTQATVLVASLGAGAAFGEEALLQDVPRNATVRMTRDGRLLRLTKQNFDRLLRSELVSEVGAAEAQALVRFKRASVIDCRTEAEWELSRLPNAQSMALETVRDRCRSLDPGGEYVVYCRSGRRSVAAVFLMRQLGIKAHALVGGMAAWPYEIEQARRAS